MNNRRPRKRRAGRAGRPPRPRWYSQDSVESFQLNFDRLGILSLRVRIIRNPSGNPVQITPRSDFVTSLGSRILSWHPGCRSRPPFYQFGIALIRIWYHGRQQAASILYLSVVFQSWVWQVGHGIQGTNGIASTDLSNTIVPWYHSNMKTLSWKNHSIVSVLNVLPRHGFRVRLC